MIIIRRTEERYHDHSRQGDVWLTFFPQAGAGVLDNGFGALESLDESRLSPGAAVLRRASRDAEVVTFVREGALAWQDSTGSSGLVETGEFRRTTARRGIRQSEANASRTQGTHLFKLWLRPGQAELEPSHEHKRFSAAERRGRLCMVGSPDGRRASLLLHGDALLFSSLLDPGTHIAHGLLPGRSAWLHVVLGEVTLGEVVLGAGDGVGVTSEVAVSLTARLETELLLLDLGPSSPTETGLTGLSNGSEPSTALATEPEPPQAK